MMNDVWCLIDARKSVGGLDATTRVAGLSLIARHTRMAARHGWAGALVLVADDDTRTRCLAALEQQPPSAGFLVEYATSEPDSEPGQAGVTPTRQWVRVALYALYTADSLRRAVSSGVDPEPLAVIAEPKDLRTAERMIFTSIRKNIDQDGVVAFYVFRVFSRGITRLLIDTSITPNQVSLAAMIMGIIAALCASFGSHLGLALAAIFFWWGAVVDCVDGEIARLRLQGSRLGEWLDSMADEVSTYGLLIGLGAGMMKRGYDQPWVAVAFVGAAVGILVHIKLYADLNRLGGAIDTAQYPWFFGTPSANKERAGLGDHLVRWVAFCFRRDAFVSMVAVLLLCDRPNIAAVLLSGGAFFVLVLLMTHVAVMAMRSHASK